ncbi:MAG: OmpA family protein [Saprospiraceae bacterium]|nr:OmpA family protein [Saprospiraceae bacterium]
MYQLSLSGIFLLLFFQLSLAQTNTSQAPPARQPLSLGSTFSNCDLQSPEISSDGQRLFITVSQHRQNVGFQDMADVWLSMADSETWSHPINLGAPVNDRAANRVVGLNASGQQLYLMNEANELLVSRKKGRFWGKPRLVNLPSLPLNGKATDYWVSLDGKTILLAATNEQDNTTDIYVTFSTTSSGWTPYKSLGSDINSPAGEAGMFLAADNKTLFFASNRAGGLGGYDLYMSKRMDNSWTNWSSPQNLGPTINTDGEETSCTLSAKGDRLYFASANSTRSLIYQAVLPEELQPEPVMVLKGKVIDVAQQKTAAASLQIQSLDALNKRITISTDKDGTFQCIVPEGESLGMYAQAQGYFSQSTYLTPNDTPLEELDSDVTAGLQFSPLYQQREADISALRERLEQIDQDLGAFQAIRAQYEEEARAERRQQAAEYGQTFYQTDAELQALQNRYDNFVQETSEMARLIEVSERQSYTFLQDTIIPTEKKQQKKSGRDRELEEMQDRYRDYFQRKKGYLPEEADQKEAEEGLLWDEGLTSDAANEQRRKSTDEDLMNSSVQPLQLPQSYTTKGGRIQTDTAQAEPLKSFLAEGFKKQDEQAEKSWEKEVNPQDEPIKPEAAVKNEIYIQAMEQEEDRLKAELEEKVRLQILEEQQAGYQVNTKSTLNNKKSPTEKTTPAYKEVEEDILLIPIEKGKIIELNNIFFKANSAILKPGSFQELERVLQFLRSHPAVVIELAVHTNGELTHTFAMQLSNKRAAVLREYLISSGVQTEQVIAQGYGKTLPVVAEDSEDGKRKNQRVEMKIIEWNE